MIDRNQFRKNFDTLGSALARRGFDVTAPDSPWGKAKALDAHQRALKGETESLQARRNRVSKQIGRKKAQSEDVSTELASMAEISKRVKLLVAETKQAEADFSGILLEIPNPPHASVPDGDSEEDNVELRLWGEPRQDEVPSHWEIGPRLGILDFEAGARLSGSRFTVLRGAGARLTRALMQFMLDMHVDRHGYEEVWPPAIVHGEAMQGTGQLPKFADDLYKLEGENAYLIPTAEVPLTNLYREMVLEHGALPLRHCAYTPCFRREAGSAGKDVRGMIRQHQFDKVELVQFVQPDQALSQLHELTGHAEAVMQALGLPYRVVELCAGDIGFSAEKTFDIEVWLPGQKAYREISSCSSFGQFQGRRAAIRVRDGNGKPVPVATINGSGLAIGRCIVALLENGWQEDGSVRLPDALHGYMGGIKRISRQAL